MDALMVSPYDDYIAYIDLLSSTEYTLHFYDIEKGKTVADFPVNPDYNGYRSCNSKIAFFGDHRCAIAGEEGIQIIDMNTLKVLWQGAKGMTVSASGDGSVVSVFNTDEKRLTFYTADGELLAERAWDDGEDLVTVNRYRETLCLNGNTNSYVINADTLQGAEFDEQVSYMSVVNENVVSCNNLDGTISFYDASTGNLLTDLPDAVADNEEPDAAYMVEDGILKKYSYEKTDKSAEEVEPVYTEEVPDGCTRAYITVSGYMVGVKDGEGDTDDTLFIMNPDCKEIFSKKIKKS